ncbi:type II toxin-antitoxin system PemK/MazF family toxin [Lactobacillus johnsonii]|uniref:type II toxin-antitoxin system PemK/MazF family toxin n=1 Tax=Lactobacillus johnsonii TaxID=33959 RepID=UPI0030C70ADB
MNKFKQGDIVWANFSPSVGQEMKGKHPAVVVSSNSYNETACKTSSLTIAGFL